eukprot:2460983-Pleurochrysis_carterae.AAC.1
MQPEQKDILLINLQHCQTCKIIKTGKTDQFSWFSRENPKMQPEHKNILLNNLQLCQTCKNTQSGKTDLFSWVSGNIRRCSSLAILLRSPQQVLQKCDVGNHPNRSKRQMPTKHAPIVPLTHLLPTHHQKIGARCKEKSPSHWLPV